LEEKENFKMSKKLTRRQFLAATGVSALGGLLAACTPTTTIVTQVVKETSIVNQEVTKVVNQEVTKVVQVTAAAPTGPKNSRGLVLPADALPLDKQVWNNAIGATGGGYGHIMESLYNRTYEHNAGYEALTTLNSDFETVGEGADSWKMAADGSYWDFTLHKGLMWTDGNPVKASDWVFTLQRSLANGYDFAWFYFDIKNASKVATKELTPDQLGIEAVDDLTLRIYTETPTPYLPSIGTWFGVASPAAYGNSMGDTNNWALDPKKYISCGPFILTAFNRGVEYDWGSNTKYTGARINYFEKIVEKPRPTTLAAYIAGDTQGYALDGSQPPAETMLVQANPVLRAESHPNPPTFTDYFGFNLLQPKLKTVDGKDVDNPFLNQDVRMALCKAIDKDALVGQIYSGLAYPAYGLIPKGFPNFNAALQNEDVNKFDVAAAKALLAKAGFPDGKNFPKFDLYIRQPTIAQSSMAQAIQARWSANLGIEVGLKPSDFQGFTKAAFTDKTAPMYYVGYSMDYYDPATFMNVFRASSVGGRHPYDNKDWTDAYNKANGTLDLTKRLQLMQQSEKDMVDTAAWFFLCGPFSISLAPCNLVGPTTEPNKDGYRFYGGGGPGCIHAYEGMYWSNSTCRASINK
jgi:oligopeptide transport system substrate-binding protein